ncbi:MAG: hypothetical protein RL662_1331 [Bacteroidota bacterium]|jgi:glycosyltransferase involved in cell wall biosynthesis
MRVAILSPFYPFRGGLAQLNARLYTQLLKVNTVKAFTFTTLYPSFLFPGKTQFVADDDNPLIIDSQRVLSSVNPISYIRTARQIDKYAPDILIIPYWMSFLAPAFGVVARLVNKKIKIVALVHNAIPHEKRFFDKAFARFFFNRCHGFIVMSDLVRQDVLALKPNAQILFAPHPIYDQYKERIDKTEACEKLGIDTEKRTLLFFGLIREYKGLDILIEGISILDDSYQLIIAGECYGDFSKYQQLIDASPQSANIKVFEQYIPDDMVTVLFSAADLLVLPYRSATQSGVVALAYQLELPMVATNVGALGETVLTSNAGIVVPQVDAESIAIGIQNYFEDTGNQALYKENIQSEKKRLSWSTLGQSLQHFFEGLI